MHRRLIPLCLPILLVLVVACPVRAWGTKEHVLLSRLAVARVLEDPTAPEGLKTWLKTVTPDLPATMEAHQAFFLNAELGARPEGLVGLSHWSVAPDLVANSDKKTKIEPFGLPERLLHFVDLEYLNTDPDRRVYRHDLSSMPEMKAIPREMSDPRYREAGMLPFAIEHSYRKLVEAFKAGRLGVPTDPADQASALRWAGYLAHYVQDNTQPLHATQDYKGVSYFADRRTAPNVHSEVEWRMNDDEKEKFPELRAAYWSALAAALPEAKDPATSDDLWTSSLELSAHSYRHLPLIGLAAMHAANQAGTPQQPQGKAGPFDTDKFFRFEADIGGQKQTVLQMKANQQAISVVRLARLWRQAWEEAHR